MPSEMTDAASPEPLTEIETTMMNEQIAEYRRWVAAFGVGPVAIRRMSIEYLETRVECDRLAAELAQANAELADAKQGIREYEREEERERSIDAALWKVCKDEIRKTLSKETWNSLWGAELENIGHIVYMSMLHAQGAKADLAEAVRVLRNGPMDSVSASFVARMEKR